MMGLTDPQPEPLLLLSVLISGTSTSDVVSKKFYAKKQICLPQVELIRALLLICDRLISVEKPLQTV